jgi:hypothetical protein
MPFPYRHAGRLAERPDRHYAPKVRPASRLSPWAFLWVLVSVYLVYGNLD